MQMLAQGQQSAPQMLPTVTAPANRDVPCLDIRLCQLTATVSLECVGVVADARGTEVPIPRTYTQTRMLGSKAMAGVVRGGSSTIPRERSYQEPRQKSRRLALPPIQPLRFAPSSQVTPLDRMVLRVLVLRQMHNPAIMAMPTKAIANAAK